MHDVIIIGAGPAGCKTGELLNKKKGNVTLQFPVLGLDGIREFQGRIKKVTFDNDLALGIGFNEVDDEYRDVIASWVENTKEYKHN